MAVTTFPAIQSKVLRSKIFKASGTWICPLNCTEVFVTGCGAGGGGAYSASSGTSGGVTSFGTLLSLSGGGGATVSVAGAGAGAGADGGVAVYATNTGGVGGSGFSSGGVGTKASLGAGGAGIYGNQGDFGWAPASGGGAGDYTFKQPLTVVSNTSYAITIGIGGTGYGAGGKGFMLIEWWE